ncbi:hypothetical protein GGX14DRAFT_484684 [Mycena pura]|uniref:Uncharacterized protein n=1 Tax=Mycena pura TaxID=153505 RepID=A0AAD6XVP0_9AGAR|nr:hypothetical protein GGX14DRAFT_484684 [Mycena pura]
MSRHGSPNAPTRKTSMRKLSRILRPRRTPAQPTLLIPEGGIDDTTPPSSPSLYSHSSENECRPKISSEGDRADSRPLLSPTPSNFSVSASEEQVNGSACSGTRPPFDFTPPGLEISRSEPTSPTWPSRRPRRSSADYTWAMNRVRPQRIIISDKEAIFINSDASSLHSAGKWVEQVSLSPSQWISSKGLAEGAVLRMDHFSPVEPQERNPRDMNATSSVSSPDTARPRPTFEMHCPYPHFDTLNTIPNATNSEPLISGSELLNKDHRRRPRSVSEPRSFLGVPRQMPRRADTVPSTPTEYILTVPTALDSDSGPKTSSSQSTISPPPPRHSNNTPMPEDVYFTAAGRRESRMYFSPDSLPRRGHSYSNSEPGAFAAELDPSSTSIRWFVGIQRALTRLGNVEVRQSCGPRKRGRENGIGEISRM